MSADFSRPAEFRKTRIIVRVKVYAGGPVARYSAVDVYVPFAAAPTSGRDGSGVVFSTALFSIKWTFSPDEKKIKMYSR